MGSLQQSDAGTKLWLGKFREKSLVRGGCEFLLLPARGRRSKSGVRKARCRRKRNSQASEVKTSNIESNRVLTGRSRGGSTGMTRIEGVRAQMLTMMGQSEPAPSVLFAGTEMDFDLTADARWHCCCVMRELRLRWEGYRPHWDASSSGHGSRRTR